MVSYSNVYADTVCTVTVHDVAVDLLTRFRFRRETKNTLTQNRLFSGNKLRLEQKGNMRG